MGIEASENRVKCISSSCTHWHRVTQAGIKQTFNSKVCCNILVNSEENVTRYKRAEMKFSAPRRNDRHHPIYQQC